MQGVTVLQLLLIFDHALTAGNTVVKLWFITSLPGSVAQTATIRPKIPALSPPIDSVTTTAKATPMYTTCTI